MRHHAEYCTSFYCDITDKEIGEAMGITGEGLDEYRERVCDATKDDFKGYQSSMIKRHIRELNRFEELSNKILGGNWQDDWDRD